MTDTNLMPCEHPRLRGVDPGRLACAACGAEFTVFLPGQLPIQPSASEAGTT